MLSSSSVRYLLTIYELSDGGNEVRSMDIASQLHTSRPAVSRSLKTMVEEGLVDKELRGTVLLTEQGAKEASELYTEFVLLRAFFTDFLQEDPITADSDARACLCYLTKEARDKLIDLPLRRPQNHPMLFRKDSEPHGQTED